ncbi:hypothetical protein [Flavobacterium sp.]|jgi:hypothetical protein|uniref:hypothetical protein n=1 Tax=Flavobacterium sp. TaxID=239 RepID=UPI0037C00D1A
MKTEVKNTLYRFITMRAPELLEKNEVDASFVQHPEIKDSNTTYTSVFLSSLNPIEPGKTKMQVLQEKAQGFENSAIKNREKIREDLLTESFYDFAIWLTKNRTTFELNEIKDWMDKLNSLKAKPFPAITLWDNLFYQIITYKSNYVRDAIIAVLVADFFIRNYNPSGTVEETRILAQARVIIPKFMFESEENSEAESNKKTKSKIEAVVNTKELQKANELLVIKNLKSQLESIKKGLLAVERKYKIEYKNSLDAYNTQYNIDTKAAYDAATPVEITHTDPVTNEITKYIEYENLELPEYNFQPEGELEYSLKISSGKSIYNEFVLQCKTDLLFSTFKEVFDLIDEKLNELTAKQFERTTTSKRVANVNGVAFATANDSASHARISSGFAITTLGTGNNQYLALTFTDMEMGTDIVSGSYSISFDDANVTVIDGEYNNVAQNIEWHNGKLVLNIFNTPANYFEAPEACTFRISGTFFSSTQRELILGEGSFEVVERVSSLNTDINAIHDSEGNPITYTGNNSNLFARGVGKYSYEDAISGSTGSSGSTDTDGSASSGTVPSTVGSTPSGSNTIQQNVINYIPSGYGIKRLGIADYRKVEQEICCYVPGEVSHIENVMAREYKEKATRRLRRQEDTVTTSKEKETEKLTDTTSTERFEMNQEVNSVLAEQNAFGANVSVNQSWTGGGMTAGADFANNTSQETSNHQAVTSAQEVTERVLERVVQKVKEERITKIIEEFEETNKHGYDNRKGDKHISGVYRWVDKIYRNQVVNYGKRLMYEFMIPEPAVFHTRAIDDKAKNNEVEELIKPIDPRTITGGLALKTFLDVKEETYSHWAGIYNAEVEAMPQETIKVGKSLKLISPKGRDQKYFSISDEITVPEGYSATKGYSTAQMMYHLTGREWPQIITTIGEISKSLKCLPNTTNTNNPWDGQSNNHGANIKENGFVEHIFINPYVQKVPIAATAYDSEPEAHATFSVLCQLTNEAKKQWQIETFNAIIAAYEDRLKEYNDKMAELNATQTQKIKTNPLFYRQIENTVLRKNCIEYMISHAALGKESFITGTTYQDSRVKYDDPNLETYAAKVKFFEQAFEWNLMSYYFYPFYWAKKENWKALYNVDEVDDAVFRSFLQSGMARVIITVRPGFEEVVNWYMATGQIWNGGQVPTMNDPLFVSIVKELQEPTGEVEQTWESRVPTSLTVIQAGTIGLNVEGLPCDDDCKDNLLFDSDGEPVLDSNGNQMNIIGQNPDDVQLGNITDELETVSESIEEIQADIEEIKNTLSNGGGN